MYVILGATGNVGSLIAKTLLSRGEKIRVVGRDAGRLSKFSTKGAEAVVASVMDADALTTAFTGARAAFLMIPPGITSPDYRADQEKTSDAIAAAVEKSELRYAVNLSSIGAHAPSGTGPVMGQHNTEQKLNRIAGLHVLHLRPASFMENELNSIGLIQNMSVYGSALKGDLKLPLIATRDIGSYAAERLLKLDFSGKQKQELLGERDLTMNEAASIIGRGIGKADLRYTQFSYAQVEQVLLQMGVSQKTAKTFIELYQGMNNGIVAAEEPRSAANTTPTSFERFVQDVFVPAYKGQAATA
jgi:uncharacterized protein YbjT (DUF2867 family)